jgi:hypothetical protein
MRRAPPSDAEPNSVPSTALSRRLDGRCRAVPNERYRARASSRCSRRQLHEQQQPSPQQQRSQHQEQLGAADFTRRTLPSGAELAVPSASEQQEQQVCVVRGSCRSSSSQRRSSGVPNSRRSAAKKPACGSCCAAGRRTTHPRATDSDARVPLVGGGGTVVELGARWVALLAGGGAAGVGCAARLPAAAAAVRPLRLPPLLPSGCAPGGAASVTAVQLHRLGRKDSSARAARRIRARCAVDIALAALASQSGPARCRVKAPRAVECSGAACAVQWS